MILLSNPTFYINLHNTTIRIIIIEILKDNPLRIIFNCITKRIKSLVIKKSIMAINNTSSDFSDTDRDGKGLISLMIEHFSVFNSSVCNKASSLFEILQSSQSEPHIRTSAVSAFLEKSTCHPALHLKDHGPAI